MKPLYLGVLAILVYGNSLQGSFHYDDFHSLVQNPHIRSLGNIPAFFTRPALFSADPDKAMYRPALLVSYAFNYAAGGYTVWGYHLFNLALHLGCGLWVWRIGLASGCGQGGAWAAALLFFLHPLATEPVNYLSSRSESLAALGWLGAFALFIGQRRGPALLCFVLALLSKEMAITLPLVLWLWERWVMGRQPAWKQHLPLWGAGAVYLGLLFHFGMIGAGRFSAGSASPRGLGTHLWTQVKAGGYYLKLVWMPVGLNVEHQFAMAAHPWHLPVLCSLLLLASLAWLAWRMLPRQYGFWLAWAGIALLPATLVPLNVLVNEHRLYLPLAGLALLAGRVAEKLDTRCALVLLIALGALSFQRNPVWRDELSLWADAARKSPLMPRVHVHLGEAMHQRGWLEEARQEFATALRLDPEHRAARTNLATLDYEVGLAQPDSAVARGYFARAAEEYEQVLKLDPTYKEALNNLGSVYLMLDRVEEANQIYRRAVESSPNLATLHFNLGEVHLRRRDYSAAIASLQRALQLQPDAETYYKLGEAGVGAGDLEAAARAYEQAGRLDRNRADYFSRRGEVLLVLGERSQRSGNSAEGLRQWQEARQCFVRALALEPGHPRAAMRLRQLEERLR